MPTLQKPIGSGFGATSTAARVIKGIDLSGKVAIVTSPLSAPRRPGRADGGCGRHGR
jgi:hypothetical protein